MPEHVHLLLTPIQSLEFAMQLVKGGFSRKFHLVTQTRKIVWQPGFTDHRIRDREDYYIRKAYLENNPVVRGLSAEPGEYRWSSARTSTSAALSRPE